MSNQPPQTSQRTLQSVKKDIKVGNFEKKYGVDLGVRSDMKLGNYFSKKGFPSLSSMLRDK